VTGPVSTKLKSEETLKGLTASYWKEAREARASGKPIAYCSILAPAEILRAMGFVPIFVMNHSAICGAAKVSTELCEVSERYGYSGDICSYPRTDIGSALSGEETKSPVRPPKADIVVVGNGQCHSITKWLESQSIIFDAPIFLIDIPFMHDDAGEEHFSEASKYVKEQLIEFISSLEELTGSQMDYSRLQEVIDLTVKQMGLWEDILDLRQNIPSPMSAFDIFTNLVPLLGLRGTPEGLAYYEQLKAEIAERVAMKIGAVPDERYRLHLDGVPCWFALRYLATKFASYKACAVTHVYPQIFNIFGLLETSRPLDSYAEALLQPYPNLGVRQRADRLMLLAEKYHLDGLVMQMSRTCKALCTGTLDICDIVKREAGIPTVIYETDQCDSRLHSEAHIDSRMEAFMEILANRQTGN